MAGAEELDMLLVGAERFLRESQRTQDQLHDNANSIIYLRTATKNLLKVLRLMAESPTTAGATPTAPTRGVPSDAQAPASTTPTEQTSPLLVHLDTSNGPVAPGSECAQGRHNWGDLSLAYDTFLMAGERGLTQQTFTPICDSCGASMSFVRTPVPAAAPTSSTSAKQDSRPSASDWSRASAPSQSASSSERSTPL